MEGMEGATSLALAYRPCDQSENQDRSGKFYAMLALIRTSVTALSELVPVSRTPSSPTPAFFSNSIGLIYPKVECLCVGL